MLNVSLSGSRISWEMNLWEHIWGIVWMIIIDVGRHILKVGSIHSLGRRSQIILNMKVIWIQGWMCSSISVSWLPRMWAAVSGPCCFEIPAMVDCTWNCELNETTFPYAAFVGVLYQSKRQGTWKSLISWSIRQLRIKEVFIRHSTHAFWSQVKMPP